jgi:hypothetical protein
VSLFQIERKAELHVGSGGNLVGSGGTLTCENSSCLCLPSHQDWFLTTRTFPVPVLELRDTLIAATMDVYATVAAQLLPTPAKSHYIFNLRDFSRWGTHGAVHTLMIASNIIGSARSSGFPARCNLQGV